MKQRDTIILLSGLPALLLLACETSTRPASSPPDPGPIRARHHLTPSWSGDSLVVYEDEGVICADRFFVYFDPELMGIWTYNMRSRNRTRILTYGSTPSVDREGGVLAFASGGHVYVSNSSVEPPLRVSESSGLNALPAVSPDGAMIAWQTITGDETGTWLFDSVTEQSRLLAGGVFASGWYPDGRHLIATQGKDIVRVDVGTGSTAVVLKGEDDRRLAQPDVSPDGEHVAFVVNGEWLQMADLAAPATETTLMRFDLVEFPSWSPSGEVIALTAIDESLPWEDSGVLWSVNVRTQEMGPLVPSWPSACKESP